MEREIIKSLIIDCSINKTTMKKSLLLLTGLVVSFIVLASLSRPAKDNVGQNIWAVNLVDVWCAVLFQQGKPDEAKAEYDRGIKIDPEMECLESNDVLQEIVTGSQDACKT